MAMKPIFARFESFNDNGRVDQGAAARIDDHDPILQAGDRLLADDMVGLRRERHVQGDDVRLGGDFLDVVDVFNEVFDFRVAVRVISQDARAKAAEILDHFGADAAGAQHGDRLVAISKPCRPSSSKLFSRTRL